jgi:HD-like signal output (HDOD) protein
VIGAERIAARVERLPALSASIARLAQLVQDEEAPLTAVEAVIRPDPGLTANVLRIANSVAFRGATPVTTVRDALARLGTRRVWEIATAAAFERVLPEDFPGYELSVAGFWRHSVAVAVYANRLAQHAQIALRGQAFTAGLLHDAGKLVVETFLLEERPTFVASMETGQLAVVSAERAVLGTDHAEVGRIVAQRWGLPATIAAACGFHHEPDAALEAELSALVGVVHVANGLAHAMGYGADIGELRRVVSPSTMARLRLDNRVLERVASESMDEIHELGRALSRPSGGDS